jgi:hypothetical protein
MLRGPRSWDPVRGVPTEDEMFVPLPLPAGGAAAWGGRTWHFGGRAAADSPGRVGLGFAFSRPVRGPCVAATAAASWEPKHRRFIILYPI